MISDRDYNTLANDVYKVDSGKAPDIHRKGDTVAEDQFHVLGTEDNSQNGMQAMATVAVIARNGYKSR
ncbi:hypothetical protein [Streptococcus sp. DD13]|uniref:hypothetical protein n=1 Tax=Streptococcus sp. DD13 TaxID=1777881 RepID=UPI0009EDA9F1|nr:hypothetical protein [Streptococcus sp. DD13]